MDSKLNEKIKVINDYLRTKEINKISSVNLRDIIEKNLGCFKISNKETKIDKYAEKGILGVDGSIKNVGATFPHMLSLIRAVTMNTQADDVGNSESVDEVFCPIYPPDRLVIDNLLDDEEGAMTREIAYHKYVKDRMAELELISAMKGIERFKSKIILMDGGFYRFEITCPNLWLDFKELCLSTGTLAVGIIEEVSTHTIASLLQDHLPTDMLRDYDRELLFGILRVGEWLKFNEDIEIKKGYYTTFARFSKHPQVIGVDFLKEQMNEVDTTMDLISSLTEINSRGVPLWIDIVDKYARLTDKETDVLLGSLDVDIKEKFLVANHNRRQY